MGKLKVEAAGPGGILETVTQQRVIPAAEQSDDGTNQTDGGPRDLFEYVSKIPVEQYAEYIAYVNRIAPEKSDGYIGKLSLPFDEDTIRTNYGGGTYRLMLKKGSEIRRAITFKAVGEPKADAPASVTTIMGTPGARSDVQAIAEMILKSSPNAGNVDMMKTAFLNAMEIQKAAAATSQMSPMQMLEMLDRMQARHVPAPTAMPDWVQPLIAAAIPLGIGLLQNLLTPKNPVAEFTGMIGAMNEAKGLLGAGGAAPKVDYLAEAIHAAPGLLRSATELLSELNRAGQMKAQAELIHAQTQPRVIPPTPGAHSNPAVQVMPATATPLPVSPQITDAQIANGAPSPQWVMGRVNAMIATGESAGFCLDFIEEQGVSVEIPIDLISLAIKETIVGNKPDAAGDVLDIIRKHLPLLIGPMRGLTIEQVREQLSSDQILKDVIALPHFPTFLAAFHMELHKPDAAPMVN